MYGRHNGKKVEIYNEYDPVSEWERDCLFMTKKEQQDSNERRNDFFEAYQVSPDKPIWKIPKNADFWDLAFQRELAYYA